MEGHGGNPERNVGRGTRAQDDGMMKMGYVAVCRER